MEVLCFDTEGVGLLPDLRPNDRTCFHVINVKDMITGERKRFFDPYEMRDPKNREYLHDEDEQDGDLVEGVRLLAKADVLIAHNATGYDFLALEIVFPDEWSFDPYKETGDPDYPFSLMDTYVMSCVLDPERPVPHQAYALGLAMNSGHSIAAHGLRIGRYKPDNEDWSKLTDHMLHRCSEDTEIGADLYHFLMTEWKEQYETPHKLTGMHIDQAYRCESQVASAVARQAFRGFRVDVRKALERWHHLDDEMQATEERFRPYLPPRVKKKKLPKPFHGHTHGSYYTTVEKLTKANGEYIKRVTNRFPEARGFLADHVNPLVAGPFTPIEFEEMSLGNRATVKETLWQWGWLGVNYSDTEQAMIDNGEEDQLPEWAGKIDEDSMTAWENRVKDDPDMEVPEWCKGVGIWYILSSRRSQILNKKDMDAYAEDLEFPKGKCRGFLMKARNHLGMTLQQYYEFFQSWPNDDSVEWRVPAEAFFNLTNTHRMTHKTVVNIPARGLYPLRDLFIAGEDKMIVGCDAAGLELRMLCHFLEDQKYQEEVLSGDPHSALQAMAELPTRDNAKTFLYAKLYGSGIANLARQLGIPISHAQVAVQNLERKLPALPRLEERVQSAGQRGHFILVDGRRARIRKKNRTLMEHTMLNVLLQGTGSLVMKWALKLAEEAMLDIGIDPAWLVNMHDETQNEVPEDEVEEMVYEIPAGGWKGEEKRTHIDDTGRMWSAPELLDSSSEVAEVCTVRRRYHVCGEIFANAIRDAGTLLGINCPLAGEYKVGKSWAETH